MSLWALKAESIQINNDGSKSLYAFRMHKSYSFVEAKAVVA